MKLEEHAVVKTTRRIQWAGRAIPKGTVATITEVYGDGYTLEIHMDEVITLGCGETFVEKKS